MSVQGHISFRCAAFERGAVLIGFSGVERVSQPYLFEVFLRVAELDDLDDPLGARASLTFEPSVALGEQPASIHGIVSGVDVLEQGSDHTLVRVLIAPRLSLLGLSSHSRVFTNVSVPDLLEAILEQNDVTADEYELRLGGSYAVEEHVCQYKETDLAFLSRWAEREGIHYFFEQDGDVEKVVFSDATTHGGLPRVPVRYHPTTARDVSAGASFRFFRARRAARPERTRLRDYDYARPSADVSGEAPVDDRGDGEISVHGYRFFTSDDGARLARIRAEELLADRTTYVASGLVYGLRPGGAFELHGHPVASLDKAYFCVELRHHANLGARTAGMQRLTGLHALESYEIDVVALDANDAFRPPRTTPWPRIHGFEAANVDGPAESDYAQIDDQGRYHAKLHFDEGRSAAGKATTALRMMQPHGGNPEGFHFPLRKGTEVMVCFLGGDPDRPVIAGAVPNALDPSPVTAKNKTRNIVHTGSDNHFEFEDLKDGQWIDVRTPPKNTFLHLGTPHDKDSHYVVLNTQADCLFAIGGDQDISVGGELHETVQKAVTETYHATQTTEIKGPQTTTVTAGVTETYENLHLTSVSKQVTEEYQSGQTTTVTHAPRLELFTAGQHTTVSGGLAQFDWTGPHLRAITGGTQNTHLGTLGVHCTSSVVDIWGSGGTQIFGNNDGTFASLNLIVGGATQWVSPSLDLHVPFWNWSGLSVTWTKGISITLCFVSAKAFTVKLARTGVSIADQLVNLSGAALALSINALQVNTFVFKIWKASGPKPRFYAFQNAAPE